MVNHSVVKVLDFSFSVRFWAKNRGFGSRHADRPVQATKAVIHAANVCLTLPLPNMKDLHVAAAANLVMCCTLDRHV